MKPRPATRGRPSVAGGLGPNRRLSEVFQRTMWVAQSLPRRRRLQQVRWVAGCPYRAAKNRVGYWDRRVLRGAGLGYRHGRTLKNGVRLTDCEADGRAGWVCQACPTAQYWEYGDQGDPVAEALTLASAWMHRCGTWNSAPIVDAFGCKPAALQWYGNELVLAESDPEADAPEVTE